MNSSFTSTISKSNPNIMEYLSQKLEAKSKTMIYFKQFLTNIFDLQTLQFYKKDLSAIIIEIEDDLKQASYAIKGLFTENKALSLEIDHLKSNIYSIEENNKTYINDLTQSHNILLAENAELKDQLLLINNAKDNNIQIDSNCYTKHLCNITEETELEIPIRKIPTQESENCNQFSSYRKNDSNDTGLNNVRNIMSDMKYNKKKLKEAIKKHFKVQKDSGRIQDETEDITNRTSNKTDWNKMKATKILIKVMSSQDNINLLNERLGNDFIQKMVSNNCKDEYLTEIENILNEAENLRKGRKLPLRMRKCKSNSKSTSKPKSAPNTKEPLKKDNKRSLSNSNIKQSNTLNQTESAKSSTSFETTLRNYPKRTSNDEKPKFNHYLNPYGKYFTNPNDQTLNIKPISYK